jgi:hypothetical protein
MASTRGVGVSWGVTLDWSFERHDARTARPAIRFGRVRTVARRCGESRLPSLPPA